MYKAKRVVDWVGNNQIITTLHRDFWNLIFCPLFYSAIESRKGKEGGRGPSHTVASLSATYEAHKSGLSLFSTAFCEERLGVVSKVWSRGQGALVAAALPWASVFLK